MLDDSFEIKCPYCDKTIYIDINKDINKCPECENIIELSWNGNPDENQDFGCIGKCSHCMGCKN